jgi:DNA mismatch repair ATPase MutL
MERWLALLSSILPLELPGKFPDLLVSTLCHDIFSSSSAHHPVGTTFRVTDFLAKIPVRKHTALKDANKTLQAIKSLLYSLAFARPEVRFSFRVLKAKNEKLNWTYAATPGQSLVEVATKIGGKDVVSSCVTASTSIENCDPDAHGGWKIDCILVSRDAGKFKAHASSSY